ncbi:hypothetical protein CTI12_AA588350 [Artemisia annua]|uniref:Uncharacterized protein n=1 Tax=Artemisia annua TaxID=35608 RepID=A0A2U1KLP0_ARTAN|nr:hypothetical protein CTI12_AA588350 [Artemisia annua]
MVISWGVIDKLRIVKISLREGKVIAGDLGDEAVVKMFNGMQRSHENVSIESELNKTLAQLNKVYESTPRVWCQKLVEKQLRAWSKIIKVIVTVIGAVIMFHQGCMKIYGPNPPHMILVRNLQNKLSPLLVFFIGPKGPIV